MTEAKTQSERENEASATCLTQASHECLKRNLPVLIEEIKANPTKGILPLESSKSLTPEKPYSPAAIFDRLKGRNIRKLGFK